MRILITTLSEYYRQAASTLLESELAKALLLFGAGVLILHAGPRSSDRELMRRTLHLTREGPALQLEKYRATEVAPGVMAEYISFGTDYGLRVPAIVYHPAKGIRRRGPAMVIVNGHGGDKSS